MKKTIWTLAIVIMALTSCSKDKNNEPTVDGKTYEAYVNASDRKNPVWSYYSLSENKLVGTGEESEADNKSWFSRTDWDIAINRYKVRTNSGAATSVGSKGGVFVVSNGGTFENVTKLPSGITFQEDKPVTSMGMGGKVTEIKSIATVIKFKTNEDGSLVMPPEYLPAPLYLFRSADGEKVYKLLFTQYLNEENVSGHVKFKFAELEN